MPPGSRKQQRNRRKGAPADDLVAASGDGAIVWMLVTGIGALARRIFRRHRS